MMDQLVDAPWDAGRDRREGLRVGRALWFGVLFSLPVWAVVVAGIVWWLQ